MLCDELCVCGGGVGCNTDCVISGLVCLRGWGAMIHLGMGDPWHGVVNNILWEMVVVVQHKPWYVQSCLGGCNADHVMCCPACLWTGVEHRPWNGRSCFCVGKGATQTVVCVVLPVWWE